MCAPTADHAIAATTSGPTRLGHDHPEVNANSGSRSPTTPMARLASSAMAVWVQKSKRWRVSFEPTDQIPAQIATATGPPISTGR